MRVCVLSIAAYPHGIGGIQDHTNDLVRGLVGAGHDVEVVTARRSDGIRSEERFGARWWFVDGRPHHMDRAWLRESLRQFSERESETPFDIVHGQGSSALGLVAAGVHRRVPTVTLFHGNFLGLAKAGMRRAAAGRRPLPILREARAFAGLCGDHFPHGNWRRLRACEAIVPSAQQLDDTVRSHLLKRDWIHVVPNGVDVGRFRPRGQTELRARLGLDDGFLFVAVGRLNYEKGFHHAIAAIAALHGDDAPRLLVVGDGEERGRLEALARELGVADRVHFAGHQSPEGVAEHLAAADAFVFPTEREEAAPLVLPQAMACGLPTIASRRGGITEVIDRPGENGLLVPPADVDELVGAMRAVAEDDGLRARLGAGARERVLENYTLDLMVERTAAVYELAAVRLRPQRFRPREASPV